MNDASRPLTALRVLRIALALVLCVHPVSRILKGAVPGFGAFLASSGFPMGVALAWAITLFELGGVICLLLGRYVRLVTPGLAFILTMGIVLVHGREGWFVVGGGRNGMEYSVILIACLATLWLADGSRAEERGLAAEA